MRFALLLIFFCAGTSHALVLEDLIQNNSLEKILKGKRVGYLTGSLDPLHKGHEAFVEKAIDQGFCDYILITPSWGGDTYKQRVDVQLRLDMLFGVFKEHPHIIVTRLTPKQLQDAFLQYEGSQFGKFKSSFGAISMSGIIGTDTAQWLDANKSFADSYMSGLKISEKDERTTLGGCIALPVNSFIVAQRAGDDISSLNGKIHDRPIRELVDCEQEKAISSTSIKEHLRAGKPVGSYVSEPVARIMVKYGLYLN
jgi:nicotinic acid mononucleotide adenylyltransferase